MSPQIGVGVGQNEVRALMLRDSRVVWRAARTISDDQTLTEAIAALLAVAPVAGWRRPNVIAAIGPAASQVKRLTGLPAVGDPRVVGQLLGAKVSRFFLRTEVPVVTPAAYRSNGCWWGAIVNQPVVAAVEAACERLRFRFIGCLPTCAALADLVADGNVLWSDGDARTSVTVSRRVWMAIGRGEDGVAPDAVIPVLRALGTDGSRYADAYGAASASRRSPLFVRASGARATSRRLVRATLFITLLASALLAASASGIAAAMALSTDRERLESLRASAFAWEPIHSRLTFVTGQLNEISHFTITRRSALQILRTLAESLPDSTAILTLSVDSVTGSMTVISALAASVLPRLGATSDLLQPRITGAVMRESVGSTQVQRIALRFGLPPLQAAQP